MKRRMTRAEGAELRERIVAFLRRHPKPWRISALGWHFRTGKTMAGHVKILVREGKVKRQGAHVQINAARASEGRVR